MAFFVFRKRSILCVVCDGLSPVKASVTLGQPRAHGPLTFRSGHRTRPDKTTCRSLESSLSFFLLFLSKLSVLVEWP
ncbi:hypothetical protein QBC46DRAFT_400814, partial [Diplogelasinospora grovesii]